MGLLDLFKLRKSLIDLDRYSKTNGDDPLFCLFYKSTGKPDRLRNRIVIKWHKSNMGYFRFDAIPGGRIQINYSAATTNFMMEE
ncbi:MAG: hypothetical protein LBH58_09010 [Tannerellaceae bacterium]|jgi:hypothetical protein|nr:hypothetical protein [Tannerellaceae bacterium]